MVFSSSRSIGAVVFAVLAAGACTDSSPTMSSLSAGPVLVECPTNETRSVTGTLGILGGNLELDGHVLALPLGAVLIPTEFTMTVPASRFVEVHVTANRAHGFQFLETTVFTISYQRCTRNDLARADLTVYKIDPETKALLKDMGGLENALLRTVTFSTDSLSAYSIAQ